MSLRETREVSGVTDRLLTAAELAFRLERPEPYVLLMLEFDRRRGLVEQDKSGAWRLTREAERRYGRALRELRP